MKIELTLTPAQHAAALTQMDEGSDLASYLAELPISHSRELAALRDEFDALSVLAVQQGEGFGTALLALLRSQIADDRLLARHAAACLSDALEEEPDEDELRDVLMLGTGLLSAMMMRHGGPLEGARLAALQRLRERGSQAP